MKIAPRHLSACIGAVLFAAMATVPTPLLEGQSSMPAAPTASQGAPAQLVDQLLTKVEQNLVPLAEAMPADKYNFAPTNGTFQGVRTFAGQVKHVIQANYSMFGNAGSTPATMPRMQDLKTKTQIVQALKDSYVFAHESVATLNGQNALEKIKPIAGIDTRAGVMLYAIIHMNDHFGQMVEYARMNGVVPPSSQMKMK